MWGRGQERAAALIRALQVAGLARGRGPGSGRGSGGTGAGAVACLGCECLSVGECVSGRMSVGLWVPQGVI